MRYFAALREFFRRLADGDPVAVSILLGMLALAGVVGLVVLWVKRNLRRSEEEWARRRGLIDRLRASAWPG